MQKRCSRVLYIIFFLCYEYKAASKKKLYDWSHEAKLLAEFQQQQEQQQKQQNSFFSFEKFVSIFSNKTFNRRK